MPTSENKPFAVVVFPEDDNSLMVVPTIWISLNGKGRNCKWPSESCNIHTMVKGMKKPEEDWLTVPVTVLHYSRTHDEASKYLKRYKFMSEVESTDSEVRRRPALIKTTKSNQNTSYQAQLLRLEAKVDQLTKSVDYVTAAFHRQTELLKKLTGGDAEIIIDNDKSVSTYEELEQLDDYLRDEESFSKMANMLKVMGGNDAGVASRRVLSRVLAHELAVKLSWAGSTDKKAMMEYPNVVKLVVASVKLNKNFTDVNDFVIEGHIKRWLRYASDRHGGRRKRMTKPRNRIMTRSHS